MHRHVPNLSELLDANAEINAIDNDGKTALMYACLNGNTSMTLKLLEAKADINCQDKSGRTALMHACDKGSVQNVSTLLNANADINVVYSDGKTVFDIIGKYGNRVIRDLLENARYVEDVTSRPAYSL